MAHAPAHRAAIATGVALTLAIAWLHLEHHRHAGELWRDEVNSVNVATMPTTAEVCAALRFDSFPPAWIGALHAWKTAGAVESDAGFRRLGLAIGLAMVAAVWWTGWKLGVGPPLATLLLFGISPSVIVYGDMVRGYGLAALTVVWAVGATWAFVRQPTWRRYLVAQIAFILAAQAHFANGVILLAIGAGAALACSYRRSWRQALGAVSLGAVAALLLVAVSHPILAYMGSTAPQERGAARSFGELFLVFAGALAPQGGSLAIAWLAAPVLAAAGFVLAWKAAVPAARGAVAGRENDDAPRAVFAAAVVVIACCGTFVAYGLTRLPTQAWHYLSLIAVCALASEVGLSLLARHVRGGEWWRIAGVAILALLAIPRAADGVRLRMTSIPAAARVIEQHAGPLDLVVVFPWYCGITFERYYRGPAPWITLPDLEDHRFHLHLAVREKMRLGEGGAEPELARVEETLRRGGRVWVVGTPVAPNAGQAAPPLPSPLGSGNAGVYLDHWEQQFGLLLERHVENGRKVPLPDDVPVNEWENLPLFVVEGWR